MKGENYVFLMVEWDFFCNFADGNMGLGKRERVKRSWLKRESFLVRRVKERWLRRGCFLGNWVLRR